MLKGTPNYKERTVTFAYFQALGRKSLVDHYFSIFDAHELIVYPL